MGPADSPRISRVLGYSGVHWASVRFRVPGCHRLWLRFPSYSANLFLAVAWILLPHSCRNTGGLGCSAFARHYWRNHCYFLFLRVLRCFSSPRWLTAWRYGHCWPGCPIRIFTGLGLFAPYRNFSLLITSFFASESLGILHAPLFTFFRVFRLSLEPATLGVDMGLLCSFTLLFPSCQGSFVENNGFEPLTPCLQSRCSSQLS